MMKYDDDMIFSLLHIQILINESYCSTLFNWAKDIKSKHILINYFKSKKYLMTPFSSQRYFIYICHLLQIKNNTFSSISLKHFAPFA